MLVIIRSREDNVSLDMWSELIPLPVKGVLRVHGKKRRGEASMAVSHRQQTAIHVTSDGAGIVGQLRQGSHDRKRAHGKA